MKGSNVAAVDMGTNSTRVLITTADGVELDRQMHITRLGQDVDETGRLQDAALERTWRVLDDYAIRLRRHSAGVVRVAATSAARDADNREQFFAGVRQRLGVEPELLSGAEEAALSFQGAVADQLAEAGPFMVFDIGGGSTEFAVGQDAPEGALSLNIGGVRLTERCLSADPPTSASLASARAIALEELSKVSSALDVGKARRWLGLAGTVTSFAAHALGLESYDPSKTHGFTLRHSDASRIFERLAAVPTAERRALLLEPKRADVIVGGAVVLLAVFEYFELESIQVSERDILDGLAASVRLA